MIFFASSHRNPKNLVEKELTHLKKKMEFLKVSLVTFLSTALLWLDQGANPPAEHFQNFICVL